MDTATIRRTFIEFFQSKGHTFVPSSPVIPQDDPTLLFTNAGMNQFKPIFLGQVDPNSPMGRLRRAANSQKCIRAGGKHNDLEDVGRDTYHHTFFEMLGNWSFGDYFKAEAIEWAWELLTAVYKIPADRLYATYFQGEPSLGLAPDEETRQLWLRYLPPDRVLPGSMKDNFWEMGATGPCGPCSEIHYDRIGGRHAAALVNTGDPNVIEIWNNVFIQFNRKEDGSLEPLPAKHVDTGMGLERLASVLQGKMSNYDTDLFTPIFEAIRRETGARPYAGRVGADDVDNVDTAYRVIADHIRTLTFALTDGAVPGNLGRNYVLRRILRRAVRYGRQMLNAPDGFFSRLVPVVVETLGDAFPELRRDPQRIMAILREEEESFGRTLDRGLKLFAKLVETMPPGGVIPGAEAFKLYDTYGFPIDLTALMAAEKRLTVDMAGFEAEIEKQRARGRASLLAALPADAFKALDLGGVPPTRFLGYETLGAEATVVKVFPGEGDRPAIVVTDATPFYAASGGQVGDVGLIAGPGGTFEVATTEKHGEIWLHLGRWADQGRFAPGERVRLEVEPRLRRPTMRNHTATHLLHKALREFLGEHVKQAGSLVAPDRLRFDFSHYQAIPADTLAAIEQRVNERILENLPVQVLEMSYDEAVKTGAMALFGEKYGDRVRVIKVGDYSKELCGGTHVAATGQIGLFRIVSESSIAAGVRRIEAITGEAVLERLRTVEREAHELARLFECEPKALAARAGKVLEELRDLRKELEALRQNDVRGRLEQLRAQARAIGDVKAIVARVDGLTVDEMKQIADDLLANQPNGVALLAGGGEKANFVLKVGKEVVPRGVHAGNLIREIAKVAGGGGGGRPDMATAGGKEPAKIDAALAKGEELLRAALGA
ncbi:MAG: Alanyl-tRNA synthetase [Candidatus Ozemobacter sibiricus]|jgi:alanyl-tRNA synthetase|uniref:Alanine--tRNA ligase n=1 Tax=Candidatus Ozemobacter sibiricus TaxID=2268124 RepID=A0A367Z8Z1_9BACT|nr:MAG: Alanyl-tRNA synthetase [Candidatus Ozemobacter sibiricus]